jgi:hypothetical protein
MVVFQNFDPTAFCTAILILLRSKHIFKNPQNAKNLPLSRFDVRIACPRPSAVLSFSGRIENLKA